MEYTPTPISHNKGETFLEKFEHPDPLEQEEWPEIESDCTLLLEKWKLDINDKKLTSSWINRTTKLFDQKRIRKPKDKELIHFLGRLAATPLNLVPGFTFNESNRYLQISPTSLAWIGIKTVLGSIVKEIKPTCFEGETIPISNLGQLIIDSSTRFAKTPFNKEKILTKGNEGVHDIYQWAVSSKLGSSELTTVWEDTITKIWDTKERSEQQELLLTTAVKLIHTPPQVLPGWNGLSLYSNNITLLWSATHKLLGSIWQTNPEESNKEKVTDHTDMEIDQAPQEHPPEDKKDQEQSELSDDEMSDNVSPQNNNPSSTPARAGPPETSYESPEKK